MLKPMQHELQTLTKMKTQIRILKSITAIVVTFLLTQTTSAQSCGCNKTLTAGSDGGIYQPNLSTVLPGQKICIAAGTYTYISLGKIQGTAAQPITIVNCGGEVRSSGTAGYGIRIVKSKYFKMTGTGTPGVQYGIGTRGIPPATPAGISIMDSTSDYEIDHCELQNVGVGIFTSKPPVDADSGTWKQGWVNKNLFYHDNYIHNAGGEAMYLGATSSSYSVLDYNGNPITVEPILQNNVQIYNNIIDSAGWDGIQLASSPNSTIHDNIVMHFGLKNLPVQQAGIIFGGKCSGTVYNNYIYSGTGNGMQIFGWGNLKVYNNIVVDAGYDGTAVGQDGIIVDDRPQPSNIYNGLQVYLMNNTVVNSAGHAVRLYNSYSTMAAGNRVVNNLLVKPNTTDAFNDKYVVIGGGLTGTINANNTKKPTIAEAKFVNAAANDYHLMPNSPAVDSGQNVSAYAINTDYDDVARPYGVSYDIGALEFKVSLPLQLISFNAQKQNNKAVLNWVTNNEENTSHFDVLRGQQPYSVGYLDHVNSIGNSNVNHTYTYTDALPMQGENYYQLRMVDRDGSYKLSPTVRVSFNKVTTISVYPNPVVSQELFVNLENQNLKTAILIATDGKQIPCTFSGNSIQAKISLPASIQKGAYGLQLITDKSTTTSMILVQ